MTTPKSGAKGGRGTSSRRAAAMRASVESLGDSLASSVPPLQRLLVDVYYRYTEPKPTLVGTARVFRDMHGALNLKTGGVDIRPIQNQHVVLLLRDFSVLPDMKDLLYPYVMPEGEDPAPKTLGDIDPTRPYAWEVEMVVRQGSGDVPGLHVPGGPAQKPVRAQGPRSRSRTPSTRRRSGKTSTATAAVTDEVFRQKGLVADATVTLFSFVSDDEPRVQVGKAEVFTGVEGQLVFNLHGHDVRPLQKPEHTVILLKSFDISPTMKHLPYPYEIPRGNEEHPYPSSLGDILRGLRYPWDISMMEAEGFEEPKTTGTSESNVGPTTILPVEQRRLTPQNAPTPPATEKKSDTRGTADSSKPQEPIGLTVSPRARRAKKRALARAYEGDPGDVITPVVPKEKGAPSPTPIKKRRLDAPPATRSVRKRLDLDSEPAQAELEAAPEPTKDKSALPEQGMVPTPSVDKIAEPDKEGWEADDEQSPTPVGDFSWDEYDTYPARVDIFKVTFPEDAKAVRNVDSGHASAVMDKMYRFGFLPNMGTFTVTSLDPEILRDIQAHIQDGKLTIEDPYGIDGSHRHVCCTQTVDRLKAASDEGVLPKDIAEARLATLRYAPAVVVVKKDKTPMTGMDIIAMGNWLNSIASLQKSPSFEDTIHTVISTCNTLQSTVEEVTPHVVKEALAGSGTLTHVAPKEYLKYARVGVCFWRNEIPSTVLHDTKIGLVHIHQVDLLLKDSCTVRLGVECVSTYLAVGRTAGARGNFQDVADAFYHAFLVLYSEVREWATRMRMPVMEVLDSEVKLTNASDPITLAQVFRNVMGGFKPSARVLFTKKQTANIQRILSQVGESLGANVVPVLKAEEQRRSGRTRTDVNAFQPPESSKPAVKKGTTKKTAKKGAKGEGKGMGEGTVRSGGVKKPGVKPDRSKDGEPPKTDDDDQDEDPAPKGDATGAPGSDPESGAGEEEQQDPFDDQVPSLLPYGFSENDVPGPWKSSKFPDWVYYSAVVPSAWPRENPIQDRVPWLLSMFIPYEHRAHLLCKPGVLREIHRQVFLHAAKQQHRKLGSTTYPVFGQVLPRRPKSPNSALKYTKEEALWQAAVEKDSVAAEYFQGQKVLLDEVGYCTFVGFVNDSGMPRPSRDTETTESLSAAGSSATAGRNGDVVEFLKDTVFAKFPGEDGLKEDANWNFWRPIINVDGGVRDAKDREKGIGRFITTRAGLVDEMEPRPAARSFVRKRALLDVRIGQILAGMRVDWDGSERLGVRNMSIPKTGGRFLYTGKDCPRQQLHTDYEVHRIKPKRNHGVFCIVTTDALSKLWVVDRSHHYLREEDARMAALGKNLEARMVTIPPFSIFVGRGDLYHAGPAYADYHEEDVREGSIRYHLYGVPWFVKLSDGVHNVKEFKPKFQMRPLQYDTLESEGEKVATSESSEEGGSGSDSDSNSNDS